MRKILAAALVLLAVTSCVAGLKGNGDFDMQGYMSSEITATKK